MFGSVATMRFPTAGFHTRMEVLALDPMEDGAAEPVKPTLPIHKRFEFGGVPLQLEDFFN